MKDKEKPDEILVVGAKTIEKPEEEEVKPKTEEVVTPAIEVVNIEKPVEEVPKIEVVSLSKPEEEEVKPKSEEIPKIEVIVKDKEKPDEILIVGAKTIEKPEGEEVLSKAEEMPKIEIIVKDKEEPEREVKSRVLRAKKPVKPTDKPEIEGSEITILDNKPVSELDSFTTLPSTNVSILENRETGAPKIIVLKQKKVVMKNLVDNISRNMLIRYFNLWRHNLPKEDKEAIERRARNSIITNKIIDLKQLTKEEEEKPLNTNIPLCPVTTTINHLKNIENRNLIQYLPEELYYVPPKEMILRTRIPERRLYPKIYDEIQKTKKDLDFHLEFLKQVPHPTFRKIYPEKMLIMMKEMHRNLALMRIFYIYTHYKVDRFYIKKIYWTRWKKNTLNLIFNSEDTSMIHLTNTTGHCFSMERIVVKEIRCGLHYESERYYDCLCMRLRLLLKRILWRHYFLRYIDRRRYYLYLWYKRVFRRIRFIYL